MTSVVKGRERLTGDRVAKQRRSVLVCIWHAAFEIALASQQQQIERNKGGNRVKQDGKKEQEMRDNSS